MEKFKTMALSNETHVRITLGLLVTFIVFLISATWGLAIYVGKIESAIKDNAELIIYVKEDVIEVTESAEENKDSIQEQEIKLAEINAKLANIENRQIEMIQILRELK